MLILASRSPRRAALLEAAGIPFEVRAFDPVDETPPRDALGALRPALEIVRHLAERKVRAAARQAPGRLLLAADTLVFLDDRILGKPEDDEEAAAMLRALSGRAHRVATGVAVLGPDGAGGTRVEAGARSTLVRFRTLTPTEIRSYVGSQEPRGKAGAYAIQGAAGAFVTSLEGDRDTVVGLPLSLVRQLLAYWDR